MMNNITNGITKNIVTPSDSLSDDASYGSDKNDEIDVFHNISEYLLEFI